MSQDLPIQTAVANGNTRLRLPIAIAASLTVAGLVPTFAEMQAALIAAYAGKVPTLNDQVGLSVDGVLKFRALISSKTSGDNGVFDVNFSIGSGDDSVTYYALIVQTGLY